MTEVSIEERVAEAIGASRDKNDIPIDHHFTDEELRRFARAAIEAMRVPDDRMVRAGDAWQAHCGDSDSLFTEMMQAALYPENYR